MRGHVGIGFQRHSSDFKDTKLWLWIWSGHRYSFTAKVLPGNYMGGPKDPLKVDEPVYSAYHRVRKKNNPTAYYRVYWNTPKRGIAKIELFDPDRHWGTYYFKYSQLGISDPIGFD